MASEMLERLQAEARAAMPNEICGLLFGTGGEVSSFSKTANVAANPTRHFEIDPAALIRAERAMREGGPAIRGYFHSHPDGQTRPSPTDAESAAADGRFWLILNGTEAAAWRSVDRGEIYGRFCPVTLDIT